MATPTKDAEMRKIEHNFNDLLKKVSEDPTKFKQLIDFTENIPYPTIRRICSSQVIHLKFRLNIEEKYEFKILI